MNMIENNWPIIVAMSGASGIPYTIRLLECLVQAKKTINIIFTPAAQMVVALETDLDFPSQPKKLQAYLTEYFSAQPEQLRVYGINDWTAPIASGTARAASMVVCPCSSGFISAVATGASDNLAERAADVMIKEKKQLILVLRETPLSAIHLENMLRLANQGVTILPANPGFYHKPEKISDLVDFIVARILDHLHIEHTLSKRWGS